MSKARNDFTLTFRGEHVRTFQSVHDSVHVVLTYNRQRDNIGRLVPNGRIAFTPSVVAWFLTAKSAAKRIKDDPTHLATYPGQSFVVKVFPGVTEVTDAEVVAA